MIKNSAQRVVFPILDADGDLVTGATTPDSEYSLDGGDFIDCSNEAIEIATNSGMYYLDLLAAETNGDAVSIIIKTATAGAKTTALVFYTSAQSLDTIDTNIDGIKTQTDLIPADPASETNVDANETKIDTITTELGKIPKSDGTSTWNATALGAIQSEANDALVAYDPPTRAELTTDKNSIIAEVDANETKIDALQTDSTAILTDTNQIQGKLPDNYIMGSSVTTDKDDEIDALSTNLDRILGLAFQNAVWEFTFTVNNQTAGGIWLYDSKANAQTHDKSTGLIGEYAMACTYSGTKPVKMTFTKES